MVSYLSLSDVVFRLENSLSQPVRGKVTGEKGVGIASAGNGGWGGGGSALGG